MLYPLIMRKTTTILTMPVDVISLEEASGYTESLLRIKQGAYVCVSNVHMCMETFDSPLFDNVVKSASLVIPDGRPLVWAQHLLGCDDATQVRGYDLLKFLCAKSAMSGLKIGLYGGASDVVLKSIAESLASEFPGLCITYMFSPPFRPLTSEEDDEVVSQIINSSVDLLFVGIGCPKQELWMYHHKEKLNCVMLGVGAAFDFISGLKKQAPEWMQVCGLEWLFRLFCEPNRLWRRYLINNPRFIYHFTRQLLFKKP